MVQFLDIEKWERKDHYHFFKDFDDPFFNICANVDITSTLRYTKQHRLSFFLTSLYLSTIAVNHVKEFRYRLRDDDIVVHDRVHPSSTVLNENNTFSFCYFTYQDPFSAFHQSCQEKLKWQREGVLDSTSDHHDDDVIYYSVIPWISFTSFTHPKQYGDSTPKIGFGKYYEDGQRTQMPVSVEVHHALADGFHVGEFFSHFNELLAQPEQSL